MSSSRTLSRKFRTFFTCIKPRFDPSIILLYIAASVEQYCDITQVNALPENEGILEVMGQFPTLSSLMKPKKREHTSATGKPFFGTDAEFYLASQLPHSRWTLQDRRKVLVNAF